MARRSLSIVLLVSPPLVAFSTSARAQTDTPWNGVYLGANLGDASSSACSTWSPSGANVDPSSVAALSTRSCSSGQALGGLQIGDMFQTGRVVWGIGLDLDAAASPTSTQSIKFTGTAPPPGNYSFATRTSPRGYAIAGPRLGYAGDVWLPYVRAGAIFALGGSDAKLNFTPAGATKADASFTGGKSFSTAGWVAGAGTEIGLNGAWSISLEFLHASLGRGSDAAATCSGSVGACAEFSGVSFENLNDKYSVNLYRIGITYWFGYWQF